MKTIRLLLFVVLLTLPVLACGISRPSEEEATSEPVVQATVETEVAVAPTLEPTPEPTPEPTLEPTPEPVVLGVEYTSEFLGLSVKHPEEWAVQDLFLIFMASSEEILTAFLEDDDPPESMDNDAMALVYAGGFDEFESSDLRGFLDETLDEFDLLEDGGRVIVRPTETTINGRSAIYTVLEGEVDDGYELAVFHAVIVDDELERVAVFIGITSPVGMSAFQSTFMAILETVEILSPEFSFDFDFDFGDADSIFFGFPEIGVVTDEGPANFIFFGIAGDVIDIIVDPFDGFDAVVDVLDARGNSILPSGEVDDSFGREEILGLRIEETGDYTISVRGFAGETGSFEITINESDADLSDLTGPGIEIFILGGFAEDERETFLFSAEAGATLTAVVDPFDGLDVVVSVLDFETEEVLLEVDFSFGQETLTFEPEETLVYLLVVEGYAGEGGDYSMTVTLSSDVIFELVDGALVYGWYDETSKHEFVVFLDEGQTLIVDLVPDDYDAVAELFDLDDNVLLKMDDGWSGEPELLTYVSPADDLYFVVSRAFSSAIDGRYVMFVSIFD